MRPVDGLSCAASAASSLAEAPAYLAHPVAGPRLDLCTRTVREIEAGIAPGYFRLAR
jgi:uncharacterized protein (DUF1810 family)